MHQYKVDEVRRSVSYGMRTLFPLRRATSVLFHCTHCGDRHRSPVIELPDGTLAWPEGEQEFQLIYEASE